MAAADGHEGGLSCVGGARHDLVRGRVRFRRMHLERAHDLFRSTRRVLQLRHHHGCLHVLALLVAACRWAEKMASIGALGNVNGARGGDYLGDYLVSQVGQVGRLLHAPLARRRVLLEGELESRRELTRGHSVRRGVHAKSVRRGEAHDGRCNGYWAGRHAVHTVDLAVDLAGQRHRIGLTTSRSNGLDCEPDLRASTREGVSTTDARVT